jgi:ribonuclease P protein component
MSGRNRESLDRDQRIRRKSDFLALRQRGTSRAHPLLVLRAVPNALDYTRFGFVVSKRVSMKAVDRNRVRRRLRDIVRRASVREGWDQLLIARKPIVEADFQTIRRVVLDLERRLDLLEKPGTGESGE